MKNFLQHCLSLVQSYCTDFNWQGKEILELLVVNNVHAIERNSVKQLKHLIGFGHYNTIEVYREVLHSCSVYIEDILVHTWKSNLLKSNIFCAASSLKNKGKLKITERESEFEVKSFFLPYFSDSKYLFSKAPYHWFVWKKFKILMRCVSQPFANL